MKTVVFAYPGYEPIANEIVAQSNFELGLASWNFFPDGESKLSLQSTVENTAVVLVCSLDRPDKKLSRLFLFSQLLRSYGAKSICLLTPYLSYMRQDKVFTNGEGVTAAYCAKLISSFADSLVTVDPHLHRINALSEIFTIPCIKIHAALELANYIKQHLENVVLIGPDAESEQWVSEVAAGIGCTYTVLEKVRKGDREVQIQMKYEERLQGKTIVLVDDIISTGRTLIETLQHLKQLQLPAAHCIAVHAVFAEDAYERLQEAGSLSIVTCYTIKHKSNAITLSHLYTEAILTLHHQNSTL
jgi:ribose-phosphate pyrophosphokinase